jgi:serine protease Do
MSVGDFQMHKQVTFLSGLAAVLTAGVGIGLMSADPNRGTSQLYAQQSASAEAAREELLVGAERLSQAFRAAAKTLRPSVVTITASLEVNERQQRVLGRSGAPRDNSIPEELRGLVPEQLFRDFSAPEIEEEADPVAAAPAKKLAVKMGVGSGVIVSNDGFILTNNHVIKQADRLEVQLSDGRIYSANVIGSDAMSDLALLKIDATGLVPAVLGNSSAMEVGDWVIAVGSPFELEQTVTAGIISATNRVTQSGSKGGILPYEDFLQTDAAINPGNSGGPLVNLRGEVIGINTAINSRTGTNAGVGFAIPSDTVQFVVKDLREHGRVRRGYIGAVLDEVTYYELRNRNLPENVIDGVEIKAVQAGAPAAKANLQKGDLVVKASGRTITSVAGLRNIVAMTRPGQQVKLEIYRGNNPLTIDVVVEEQTEEKIAAMSPRVELQDLGIVVQTLTPELAEEIGLESNLRGAVVIQMSQRGIAARDGLRPADVITGANGMEIASGADVLGAFRSSQQRLVLNVIRGNTEMVIPLNLRR